MTNTTSEKPTDRRRGVPADVLTVAVIWAILTVALELLATFTYLPTQGAREAQISDSTFRILTFMGIPVVTFVYTVIIYSFVKFRAKKGMVPGDDDVEDGEGFADSRRVSWIWLIVTATLAIASIFYPGITELRAFEGDRTQDLEIKITAMQFAWLVQYPDQKVAGVQEIVLPVDSRVRFDITSNDVIHSFWVPAFRAKIDAVPGRHTSIRVTPIQTGGYPTNSLYRLQCAELCGLRHSMMMLPVRVVEQDEFDAWVQEHQL